MVIYIQATYRFTQISTLNVQNDMYNWGYVAFVQLKQTN